MTQTSEFEIVTNGTAHPAVSLGSGSAAPGSAAGPRLPRREQWLDLPDEYPEFKVKVWVNYPRRFNDELSSGDAERMKAALLLIVLEHNGWCDADGSALPPANDATFWDSIPDELAASVISLLTVTVGKLAASIRNRSGR